jgi:hypothetical protein
VPLLARRFALLDIDDVERFCRRVLTAHLRRTRAYLRPADEDDALAYLIALCWELSLRHDPAQGVTFATYAYRLLSLRVVDWRRQQEGRTRWQFAGGSYERARVDPLSLNARRGGDDGDAELGESVAARTGDPAVHRDPDLVRVLAERSGEEPWREHESRQRVPRRAPRRTRAGGARR